MNSAILSLFLARMRALGRTVVPERLFTRGRRGVFISWPAPGLTGEREIIRAHGFTASSWTSDGPRFWTTFKYDPALHSDVQAIYLFFAPVNKLYRLTPTDLEGLVGRALGQHFGWTNDPVRGFRGNVFTSLDELHPTAACGNPAGARLLIRPYLCGLGGPSAAAM